MLLLNAALALAVFAGTAVQAKTIDVSVGASGNTFDPTSVTAADTDIVVFTLYVVSAYPDAHPLLTLPPARAEPIPSLSRPSRTPATRFPVV